MSGSDDDFSFSLQNSFYTIQSHAVHLSDLSVGINTFLSWTTISVFTMSADRRVTGRKLSNRREFTLSILHTDP